ncbi:ATP-binding protein, partial [Candidatus Albibeggiatoa sp. nov. BB20]|uniref:ATP-binding protein n=1 Tax=Candidatus Albibeggiatoa sp. nov. BB20 TaxID=3162723 RepID=UPI0033655980
RSTASTSVNRLLQASLENAMLKQDLEGLRDIINRLGQQKDIKSAFIINPMQEIRFASDPSLLGKYLHELPNSGFKFNNIFQPSTQFIINEHGEEVLRSINPVHNKPQCIKCHGLIQDNPINGILFVDYDGGAIKQKAERGIWALIGAGLFVVLLSILVVGWFMHRFVLAPIQELAEATVAIADGYLSTRIKNNSHDELGKLAHSLNVMAENLQRSLREIKEQRQFLQSLIDAIPDGIRVINQNYEIIQANKAYHEQLHLKNGSSIQTTCHHSSHARQQPCPATLVICPYHEINKNLEPLKIITEYQRDDGETLPVEVCAAPMQVEFNGQKMLFIVESIRDLTQTIDFSHEQKLSSVGQLAAGVAHEIYNPLSSIRLALQSSLREVDSDEPNCERMSSYLRVVDKQIDKCIDVTQRLLKLSATSSDRAQLISLNEVIDDTVSLLNYEGQLQDITMSIENPHQKNYRILASESDMRMLVLNLFQNAFHAMPQGGEITVDLFEQDSGIVTFAIQDTGVGVRASELDKIFDPFFSHRADGVQGTGLGLTICRSIVERYQGQIEINNDPQIGCQFIITLPLAEQVSGFSTRE